MTVVATVAIRYPTGHHFAGPRPTWGRVNCTRWRSGVTFVDLLAGGSRVVSRFHDIFIIISCSTVSDITPGGPGLPGSPGTQGEDFVVARHDPAASVLRNKTGNQLRARSSPTLLRDIFESYTAERVIGDKR